MNIFTKTTTTAGLLFIVMVTRKRLIRAELARRRIPPLRSGCRLSKTGVMSQHIGFRVWGAAILTRIMQKHIQITKKLRTRFEWKRTSDRVDSVACELTCSVSSSKIDRQLVSLVDILNLRSGIIIRILRFLVVFRFVRRAYLDDLRNLRSLC